MNYGSFYETRAASPRGRASRGRSVPLPASIALISIAATLAALVPAPAEACGPLSPEELATMAVDAHLRALDARDLAGVIAAWSPAARITSVRTTSSGSVVTVEPIAAAARRWVGAKQRAAFVLEDVVVEGPVAAAHLHETTGGRAFDDTLLLARDRGVWRIVGAVSRALADPPSRVAGY